MSVSGTWNCTIKTPMGDQNGTLTVNASGDTFSGQIGSPMMGTMPIEGGTVSGDTLTWQMKMTTPMPMDLDCQAKVTGDSLKGTIKAGMFGAMDLTGTRA